MALRWRRSAAQSRAICLLRRTSLRSHFVVARVAARAQAAMARLRSIAACRSSSKDEIGGLDLSFTVMVGSSTARGLRCCFAVRGLTARAARELGRLARSGPAGLKERFARAGVFLEIFCRCWKITPNGEFPPLP